MNLLAFAVVIVTYALIATRGVSGIPPWASMFFGGVMMIVTGVITPQEGFASINLDVILFLITLFTFASALEVSGFLKYLGFYIVNKFKTPSRTLFGVLLFSGLLSNLVTNDGVSASWTPVILESSKKLGVDEKPFLYALAFGVTIGSVMLPTGNPQNLLIALDAGLKNPFIEFAMILVLPTLINLALSYPILLLLFRKELKSDGEIGHFQEKIEDPVTAYTSLALLGITVVLFFSLSFLGIDIVLGSLTTSSILILVSKRSREIIRRMDWSTILFFIGLFMFTEGMIKGGVLSAIVRYLPSPSSVFTIMLVSVLVSQLLSNVPLVAIYIPVMISSGATSPLDWLALAAGSTIAGNFTLIGAASNVIISESSESRGGKGFGFIEFIKNSVPLLIVNFLVLYLFLRL
ncbi:MAG: anion transporter [Metallosphaera sp.]|uniref:SLC13 family permease n=1 Tax=Metallosphaera sp. TaxID=2020860 RepID=UPI00317DEC91